MRLLEIRFYLTMACVIAGVTLFAASRDDARVVTARTAAPAACCDCADGGPCLCGPDCDCPACGCGSCP